MSAAVLLAGCRDGGDEGDPAAFCDAVEALAAENPFEDLAIASPGEMRSAFERLSDGAAEIAANAPPEHRADAEDYRDSVQELVDQLRGAGFDPRALDALAYRSAVEEYERAAVAVERAAAETCPTDGTS